MDGVMIEGYGQRFGERLRVQNAPRDDYPGIALCDGLSALHGASPIIVISRACSA
jgi:hypothetical protein